MEKELDKLQKLTGNSAKGKSIQTSLDAILSSLHDAQGCLATEQPSSEAFSRLAQTIEQRKKEIDGRQKEVYSSLARYGKGLDKKFPASLPTYPGLFATPLADNAFNKTVVLHLLRTGQFDTAEVFLKEAGGVVAEEVRSQFGNLHQILSALRAADIAPAIQWVAQNAAFLESRASPLEFYLHRSHYIRLLVAADAPAGAMAAIQYANGHLRSFYGDHTAECNRLFGALIHAGEAKLRMSSYSDLASPTIHADLEPMFTKDYCASLNMNQHAPLRIVADIGGGGALARIEKGIKVMKDRKSEWSQTGELPIEVPLGPEHRYHSIFACPVSKEQATEQNPPMMLTCGHVITKESLQKVNREAGRIKCPYCPVVTIVKDAVRVYF